MAIKVSEKQTYYLDKITQCSNW